MKICLHITDIFADNFWMESDTLFWQYDVNSSSSSERNRFLWWLCSVVLNWMCCVWTDWKGETGKRVFYLNIHIKKIWTTFRSFAYLFVYRNYLRFDLLLFCFVHKIVYLRDGVEFYSFGMSCLPSRFLFLFDFLPHRFFSLSCSLSLLFLSDLLNVAYLNIIIIQIYSLKLNCPSKLNNIMNIL